MKNKKIEQLAEMLGIEAQEIEVSEIDNEFFTPEGTYAVMDENEAKEAHKISIAELVDECGIASFSKNFQEEIMKYFIDNDTLENIISEYYDSYCVDIESESDSKYANRLIAECVEAGIISDKDLTADMDYDGDKNLEEELSEHLTEDIKNYYGDSLAKYFSDSFGQNYLRDMIKEDPSLIDVEGISERCADYDGYGNLLSSYDCATLETEDFYVFKQSDYDERSQEFLDELESDDFEH